MGEGLLNDTGHLSVSLSVRPRYVVSALRFLFVVCILATILKIAAKMAAMATIFKSHLSLSHS
jgi:hypothetical protein